MPKSKVRKKSDFTVRPVSRTPVKVKAGPSSVWFVAFFIGLMLIGLVWLLVFQLGATGVDVPSMLTWMANLGAVELRDRVCFHDHRIVAHDAVALRRVPSLARHTMFPACFPTRNVAVTQSHHCDSSPLCIAPVDKFIRCGNGVWMGRAAN